MYYVLLMGSGFLLALAIGQLCLPRRNETNHILCQLFFVSFVWLTHGIGFKLGMLEVYPHLNKLYVPFLAATGPLWYFYVRALLTGQGRTRADRRHLLPVIVSTVLLLPFLIQSEEFKRAYIEVEISGFVHVSVYLASRIAELTAIAYLVLTIRLLKQERVVAKPVSPARSNAIVLTLTTLALVAAISRLFGSMAGNHTISVFLPIGLILVSFIGFYCLSHRHLWLLAVGVPAPRVECLTPEGSDRLKNYRDRVQANGWHLDPNLKIQQLARRLSVPSHDLSELINRESGGNFNHFVNALRIEHAKVQLRKYADKPVLDIALASGFNSASAFYAQFSRFESMPPATYRRLAIESVDKSSEIMS